MLTTAYRPLLTRSKPTSKLVKVWPEGAITAFADCFETTDWSVFKYAAIKDQGMDIEEYAEAVSGYISKYTKDVCVSKRITIRANEKPWMTTSVCLAESKKRCF